MPRILSWYATDLAERPNPYIKGTAAFNSEPSPMFTILPPRQRAPAGAGSRSKPRYYTRNQRDNYVLARIRRSGKSYEERFRLQDFKSWEKAEAAAKRWIKLQLPLVPAPLPAKGRKTVRNKSGVVGVKLKESTRRKNGRVYRDWRWIASWPGCSRAEGIGWGVNKYGDKRAFVTACLARRLESEDREYLDALYQKTRGTPEFRAMVKLKAISPPADA